MRSFGKGSSNTIEKTLCELSIVMKKMSNRCNLGEMGQTNAMVFAILKKAEIRFF